MVEPRGNALRTHEEGGGLIWAPDFRCPCQVAEDTGKAILDLSDQPDCSWIATSNSNGYHMGQKNCSHDTIRPAWIHNPQKFLRENKMVALLSSNVLG